MKRISKQVQRTVASQRKEAVVKNFHQYTGPGGQVLHGYARRYKNVRLRKKGFTTKTEAERHLRQAMNDIDAEERGEIRSKPTTAQEALNIYRRNLEVRARDKGYQYAHNVRSNCKVIQEFVNYFGPNRLIRECTETDLREFYQMLCFRPTLNKNSAGVFIGRVQGMLKAAQKAKPDLVNWLRPTLKVNRTPEFEHRVVELTEYATLVHTLLNPPLAPSRRAERTKLWRDAGDVVQLLRLTGGRLNEIVRLRLDQFMWTKGKLRLYATKTENERDLPLWDCIKEVAQRRIKEGLTDEELLFPRAKTATFDNAIARACRKAGKVAGLNYGRTNGFTCHSLRHTFISDMMEASGNNVALVMSYSGHKSLESFNIYLHAPEQGCIFTDQRIASVGLFLASFSGMLGPSGISGTVDEAAKPVETKQVAVS
ncbi:MAG: tyrosine-type recombinase/integrase [Acidobacteriota bacterium]